MLFAQQQAEVQRQTARANAMREAIAAGSENPDAETIGKLFMQYPEIPKGLKQGWDIFDEDNQESRLRGMGQVYSALATGNIGIAEKPLDDRVKALKNDGDVDEAAQTEAVLELLKASPEAAKMSLGMGLKALGGNKYDSLLNASKVSRSKDFGNGTVLRVMSDGSRVVTNPNGEVVTGPEAARVMKEAAEFDTLTQGSRAGARETGKLESKVELAGAAKQAETAGAAAAKIATESFKSLGNVRKNILNIDLALEALEKGADTGAVAKYFPSIRSASVELDNARQRMGL
ncbi:MAG: hypothetical protein JKY11_06050, partial [Alphaproteobacteria bacterium]|nr:hypothetical protein [Alphaproteobacteria bacterium]